MFGSCLDGKPLYLLIYAEPNLIVHVLLHAENSCATSHIEYDFVFEEMAVLVDGIAVRSRPDFIFLARLSVYTQWRKRVPSWHIPTSPRVFLWVPKKK
jgi:hypothetical protein